MAEANGLADWIRGMLMRYMPRAPPVIVKTRAMLAAAKGLRKEGSRRISMFVVTGKRDLQYESVQMLSLLQRLIITAISIRRRETSDEEHGGIYIYFVCVWRSVSVTTAFAQSPVRLVNCHISGASADHQRH